MKIFVARSRESVILLTMKTTPDSEENEAAETVCPSCHDRDLEAGQRCKCDNRG